MPEITIGERQLTEVYSRVVGYIRPVESWNDAKQEEFQDRVTFKMPKEVLCK